MSYHINKSGDIAMLSYMGVTFYILTKQSYMALMTVVEAMGFEKRYNILSLYFVGFSLNL